MWNNLNNIGVGVIGTGKHGSRYARHILSDVKGLHLSAICRRSDDGRRQAEQWNCSWYTDWRDLVADERVDAVIVVTPPSLHLSVAMACAAIGKPLLLEKPLAVNVAAGEAIVDLAASGDFHVTVGQTLRYNSVIQSFRRHFSSIGHFHSFSANQRLEPSTLSWHEEPALAGAGVSYHTAIHIFDALRYITGHEVRRVMAQSARRHSQHLEDLLMVLVELEHGVLGTVDCSKVGAARSGRFEFVGETGQLIGDQVHYTCETRRGMERIAVDVGEPMGTIVPLLQQWRSFLQGQAANPIPGKEGLAALRVCAACLESARTGGWITL